MININTGYAIANELQSIQQSIADIVSTPIGSRVMRREYGSLIPELIDQPINEGLILKCYSAIYSAILRWEDRISLNQISIFNLANGKLAFDMEVTLNTSNQSLNMRIPLNMGAST